MAKTSSWSLVGDYLELQDSETGMKARVGTVVLIDPVTALPYRCGAAAAGGGASDTLEVTQLAVKLAVQSLDGKLPQLSAGKMPVTDPISLPLPAGAATAAGQAASNVALSSVDGKLPALVGGKVSVTDPTALPLPTGAATATAQATGNASLSSVDGKLPALVGGKVSVTDPTALPLPAGAATELTLLSLNAKTPALGAAAPAASSPVSLPNNLVVGAAASVAALNIDLLTGAVSGWYDAANFHSVSLQLIGAAGISAGAIIFEQTNDITAAAAGNVWPVEEQTSLTPTPNIAALSIAASTVRMFGGAVTARFVRVRVSTAFLGGNVQCVAVFSQLPYWRQVLTVHQATAGNFQATATLAAGTNLAADMGIQARANAAGAASTARVLSVAGTNANNLKNTAGRVIGYDLINNGLAARYLKWHNTSAAPTAGAAVMGIVPIGPNGGKATISLPAGMAFTTGISYSIVTGAADADVTGVGASDVVGSIFFA